MNIYEKKVNISVCKSNIKKNEAYFGRVCKNGKVGTKELLQELNRTSPYIDISMMRVALEKLTSIVFDFVASGFDVDFFNLGIFSLATKGKLEMKEEIRECESNGDYDVSEAVNNNVQFSLKFSPSKIAKEGLKNVKLNLAIKKNRVPSIEKIEVFHPKNSSTSLAFIKIKGDGLKVEGDDAKVGIYIEEKEEENLAENFESRHASIFSRNEKDNSIDVGMPVSSNTNLNALYKTSSSTFIKIQQSAILRNEPKSLMIMLEDDLKPNCEYNIRIITQYREGGATKILREGKCECILIAQSSAEELENIHVSTIEEKGHFKHKVGTLQSSIFQNKKVA